MAKRILVLEDEEDVAELVKMTLSMHGYEVDHAFDEQQGVQKIKARRQTSSFWI